MAISRILALMFAVVLAVPAAEALGQAYCAPPKKMPSNPPPPPPPPICQPQVCGKCTTSPCYVDSGIYVNDAVDLSIVTSGFPLLVSRHYDSSEMVDGPLGIGWSSSLAPHLYYATYLYAANVYQYEADVTMPDGTRFTFKGNSDGSFTPPFGRHDTLVRNADGSFTLTPQRSRAPLRFAADGSLTTMTDEFGNAITLTYDGNGRVQTVADSSGSGRSLNVSWNPQGRIADISDSSSPARHVIYSYNFDGTLAGMRDPITPSTQQSLRYTYTTGRYGPVLARIEDRWGRLISRLTWQSDGKLLSYTDGDYNDTNPAMSAGEKYTYAYDTNPTNGTLRKTSSLGTVAHQYMQNGLITDHASYDSTTGNLQTKRDEWGHLASYTYDSNGKLSTMAKDDGPSWLYTYDTNFPDKVASVTAGTLANPSTKFSSWAFDYNLPSEIAAGALKRVKRFDTTHTMTQTMAEYAYDSKGHVLSATDEHLRVTTYQYDAQGDRTTETIAGQTTTFAYDAVGRVTTVTDAAGHVTSFTYDALDRILTIRQPPPSAGSALAFVTTCSYDNVDNGIVYTRVTDPNGRVTTTGYDALGHVVRVVDALGNTTQYTYQYNLLKSVTDANGNVTSYNYDANRHLSGTTFPNGSFESVVSGFDGSVMSVADRRGITVGYARDGLGRLTSVGYTSGTYPNSTNLGGTTYTYDGEMLASVSFGPPAQQSSTSFTYDNFWQLQTESRSGHYAITYQHTTPSRALNGYTITPATSQPGPTLTINYGFDDYQRINSIYNSSFGAFNIEYNSLGKYNKITYPNGQTRSFTYDDQGRLTYLRNFNPNVGDIATFQYDYDYDWTSGGYSMLRQLTAVTMSGPATPYPYQTQIKYTYDANYQLTGALQGATSRLWTYDAIGNRTSGPAAYTYYKNGANPLNGRLLQNDGAGADFTYDANGNVTGRTGSVSYTWDYANRLASTPGVTYGYDHAGRRISATANATTTKYIAVGMNTVRESAGSTVRDYIFAPGIDQPLAKWEAGALTYYSVDGLGSVVASSDAGGTIVSSTFYDAWGVATPLFGQQGAFGYTGRETAGFLLFLRARYYDPAVGRFISEDPVRRFAPGAPPDYSYAMNDPLDYSDPLGYYSVSLRRTRRTVALNRFGLPTICRGQHSCTDFNNIATTCGCYGCDAGFHMGIGLVIDYDMYLAHGGPAGDPIWETHEMGHVDDIRSFMGEYLASLESNSYLDEGECETACQAVIADMRKMVQTAAQRSQAARH